MFFFVDFLYNFGGFFAKKKHFCLTCDGATHFLKNPPQISDRDICKSIGTCVTTASVNPTIYYRRMQYRHAIIAPSQFDAYGGSAFPGLGKLNCKKILQSTV